MAKLAPGGKTLLQEGRLSLAGNRRETGVTQFALAMSGALAFVLQQTTAVVPPPPPELVPVPAITVQSEVPPIIPLPGPSTCFEIIDRPVRGAPEPDHAALRATYISRLQSHIVDRLQWAERLAPAAAEPVIIWGGIEPGAAFAAIPVQMAHSGRLAAPFVARPVFGRAFTMFEAGTPVWGATFQIVYNCNIDTLFLWCGERNGPDQSNRAHMTCFGARDSDWLGAFEVHGSPVFPAEFVKHIEASLADTPEVIEDDSLQPGPMRLILRFKGWVDGRPDVELLLDVDGTVIGLPDMITVLPSDGVFEVHALTAVYRMIPVAGSNRAILVNARGNPRFDPAAIRQAAEQAAARHVDAAIAARQAQLARRQTR
jgi:hypothetical protein